MPKKARRSIGQRKKYTWCKGKTQNPATTCEFQSTEHVNITQRPENPLSYESPNHMEELLISDTGSEHYHWFFNPEISDGPRLTELKDSDGHTADAFFLVLDKVYQYNPVTEDVDELHSKLIEHKFFTLRETLKNSDIPDFNFVSTDPGILLIQLYTEDITTVKLSVRISRKFQACIEVHRVKLDCNNDFWLNLPTHFNDFPSVHKLLSKINRCSVCIGNPDDQFVNIVPRGQTGYTESDMGAVGCEIRYRRTIRAVECQMLCEGVRCQKCSSYRGTLRKAVSRNSKNSAFSKPLQNKPYRTMTREELVDKCQGLRTINRSVERQNSRMRKTIQQQLKDGLSLDESTSVDLASIMNLSTAEVKRVYPDQNCYQRLFWDEQLKYSQLKGIKGMKWHPMIIKWCLHLQSKSSAAYESLHESGFIKLPSSRTLYDYSHFLESRTGFQPDVVEHLVQEMSLHNITEDWKKYAGILFDEIKIKSDLVYDKHSGELVGYVNLDKIGNDLFSLEHSDKQMDTANHILVLMVRGIATRLKYPFAHFATKSITADFIFFIIQAPAGFGNFGN